MKKTSILFVLIITFMCNLSLAKDVSNIRNIYFAGGCFWGVEEYFSRISGVLETKVGYANSNIKNPSYKAVLSGKTNGVETVYIKYDNNKITLQTLTNQFFKIINPISKNKQGNDVGSQYRTGVYYENNSDLNIIKLIFNEHQKKYTKPIQVEVLPKKNFYIAEEYHQKYLKKNPNGYCHISFDSLNDLKK